MIFVYGVVVTNDVREIEQSAERARRRPDRPGGRGLPASAAIEGTESATGEEPITGAEPTETSPLQIDAIAQQWLWRFEYLWPAGPAHLHLRRSSSRSTPR